MKVTLEWFNTHFKAIVGTAVVVAKAGLLGKVGTAIVTAVAVACGVA